jgi:SAM domain (Sterile alpha motif)
MQQVSDWLEKLGLVQYAQRFAENDITIAILPDLTGQDLMPRTRLARTANASRFSGS